MLVVYAGFDIPDSQLNVLAFTTLPIGPPPFSIVQESNGRSVGHMGPGFIVLSKTSNPVFGGWPIVVIS